MRILSKGITLLKLSVNYLSMLSLRSKNIYIFGSWEGNTFSDNPKFLFLEAAKDKSITSIWITKKKDIYEKLKEKGYKAYMCKSVPGIYYQLRASVYFTCMSKNDVFSLIMGNATRVNLWHGVGFKKILHDNKIINNSKQRNSNRETKIWKTLDSYPRRKEYIISTSDTMSQIFASAFQKNKEKILQLGQPRNDIFYCDEFELEKFTLKKDSIKKIILYMPTHRNAGKKSMNMDLILNLNLLDKLCIQNDVLFLIKKHYYHYHEVENLVGFSNIKDITQEEYDPQQLLKHTDILITDYSSCFIDFLLLDRPIIFYNYDYNEYRLNDRDLYFDYDSTTPGLKVKNFEELFISLNEILSNDIDLFSANRKAVKELFYSKDNQQAVGKKILQFVKQNL